MRIIWNDTSNCFQAVLTPGALWQKDLDSVKEAGFRTSGPPDWLWQAMNVKAVMKLRAHKPESGLTISPEALAKYLPQAEMEAKNEEVKKQLAEGRKAVKKEQKKEKLQEAGETFEISIPDKGYKDETDFPPWAGVSTAYIPPIHDYQLCSNCADPVYFYEQQNPPLCLWCEKLNENHTTKPKS